MLTLQCCIIKAIELIVLLSFYRRHPISLTQADTAVSGKLILAKYVHSEIEKEEEEQLFAFFFSLLVTQDRLGGWEGGGSVAKIGSDSNARKVK